MAVAVKPCIGHLIVVRALRAQRGGPFQKTVVVVVKGAVLAVAVVYQRGLRHETHCREVLVVEIGQEDVVVTQARSGVVEAAVGVFFQTSYPGQVVLKDIVIPGAEQAHAQLAVLKQEAAKIAGEGLYPHAEAVEVVAIRDVAQVLVEK